VRIAPATSHGHLTLPEEQVIATVDMEDHDTQDMDIEMGGVRTDSEAVSRARPICIRLYEEPRAWWHTREIDFVREASGDVNLVTVAKLLALEGSVRVSTTVPR
jgi:hypothetical protein